VHTPHPLHQTQRLCDVAGRRVPHVKRSLQTGIEHQRDCPSNGLQSQDCKQIREAKVPPVSRKPSAKPSKLDSYKNYIIQRLNSGPLTAVESIARFKTEDLLEIYIVKDLLEGKTTILRPGSLSLRDKAWQTGSSGWAECGRIENR